MTGVIAELPGQDNLMTRIRKILGCAYGDAGRVESCHGILEDVNARHRKEWRHDGYAGPTLQAHRAV